MLPPLPYPYNALEPVISEETLILHHDRHHQAYVNRANEILTQLEEMRHTNSDTSIKCPINSLSFNLDGLILHDIYWDNMREPIEDNRPSSHMAKALSDYFGTVERFQKEFSDLANTVEGSGWAALFVDGNQQLLLSQIEKHNVNILAGNIPILVLDVWEHAYYHDYENERARYVENWWKLVNWDNVEERLNANG